MIETSPMKFLILLLVVLLPQIAFTNMVLARCAKIDRCKIGDIHLYS